MPKVYVKIGNVYFGRRWFKDRYGNESSGKLTLIASKLFAIPYETVDELQRDMIRLDVTIDQITIVKVS